MGLFAWIYFAVAVRVILHSAEGFRLWAWSRCIPSSTRGLRSVSIRRRESNTVGLSLVDPWKQPPYAIELIYGDSPSHLKLALSLARLLVLNE